MKRQPKKKRRWNSTTTTCGSTKDKKWLITQRPSKPNVTVCKADQTFSGPIVNRRTQMYRQQRRKDLDKYKYQFKSASGRQFKKSTYNPFDVMQTNSISNQNRAENTWTSTKWNTHQRLHPLWIFTLMRWQLPLAATMPIECPNEEINHPHPYIATPWTSTSTFWLVPHNVQVRWFSYT